MAATPIATGHGSTITFATSAWAAAIISIGSFEMNRGKLDKTNLASGDYREFIPGDIVDAGSFTLDFFADMNSQPPVLADPELVTIKIPDSSTGTVGAGSPTVAANAFIESASTPEIVTGSLMRGQALVCWSTGPTFSDET
jgi:hypothetical protein